MTRTPTQQLALDRVLGDASTVAAQKLTATERDAFAAIAAGLSGGRFAHLAKDADVKAAAAALVAPARDARKRAAARTRTAGAAIANAQELAIRAAMRESYDGYSPELAARIDAVFAAFASAPKRVVIRRIARAILRPDRFSDDERALILRDWRPIVRAYASAQAELRRVGSFPISRNDMRADGRSRFYRNVMTHWHSYAGGKHVAVHGVTPDDAFQDAMVSALESGDYVTDVSATATGRVTAARIVPQFGTMYKHTRGAVETAVFKYRRMHSDSQNVADWTWSDWERWATENNGADRFAHSTLAEWQAFDAARTAHAAAERAAAAITERREAEATYLEAARQSLATLVLSGMTVRRIANVLGRTPEGILSGLGESADTPRFI